MLVDAEWCHQLESLNSGVSWPHHIFINPISNLQGGHHFLILNHHHCLPHMSYQSGGTPDLPCPSAHNKQTWTVSSHALGEALAPLSQKPCSTPLSEPASNIKIDQGWEVPLPLPSPVPVPPSACLHGKVKFMNHPSPSSSHPGPPQDEVFGNIAFQVAQLDNLIHQVEGSSFGLASPALEWLLENLTALFFP
ncbi:hypothetical protein AX15_006606 [Amanita polypyramis BW_CC]|nr:hypothetical protein AX15_006606 [Amanita polypyramis BW_CC]